MSDGAVAGFEVSPTTTPVPVSNVIQGDKGLKSITATLLAEPLIPMFTFALEPYSISNNLPEGIVAKRKLRMGLRGGKNKRKYSKKTYQFSKNKNRTKKQLI